MLQTVAVVNIPLTRYVVYSERKEQRKKERVKGRRGRKGRREE